MNKQYPEHIDIDLTSTCNLDCVFCHLHYFDPKEKTFLKYEQFIKLENIFPYLKKVTLFGKFEPLLCKDFIPIFEKVCEYKNIESYFSTNALLLSEDIIKTIVGRLKYITVSITGFNEDRYHKYMGKNALDQLKRNITLLNEYKIKNNTDYPILRISTVGMADTLSDLEKAVDFAKEFNAKEGIQLTSFIAYSKEMEDQVLKTNESYFKERIITVLQYAQEKNVKFVLQSGDFEENYEKTSDIGHKECSMPWERVSIQPDGEVYPCPVATKSIGNFFNDSIENIFNSKEMETFRKGVNDIENMNEDCSRCLHCRHKSINEVKNNICSDVDILYSQMTRKKEK